MKVAQMKINWKKNSSSMLCLNHLTSQSKMFSRVSDPFPRLEIQLSNEFKCYNILLYISLYFFYYIQEGKLKKLNLTETQIHLNNFRNFSGVPN